MSDPQPGNNPYQQGPPPPPQYTGPTEQGQRGEATRPPVPPLVKYLSIGLFVLVALQIISAIVGLASIPTAVDKAMSQAPATGVSPETIEASARAGAIATAIVSVILAGVFVWLTLMVRKGRNWARITSTVFLALGIVSGLVGSATGGATALITTIGVVMLLLEIAVLVMLWMQPSNAYFKGAAAA